MKNSTLLIEKAAIWLLVTFPVFCFSNITNLNHSDCKNVEDNFVCVLNQSETDPLGNPNRKLSLALDGRNDFAESIPLLGDLPQASIMGWIKLDSDCNASFSIIGQSNFTLKIIGTGNTLAANINGKTFTTNVGLSTQRWYHIAAVYNGTSTSEKLQIYLNGKLEFSSNDARLYGKLQSCLDNFSMGRNAKTNNEYFSGALDEVRVFNTALTTTQLQKMVYQEIKQNGDAIQGEVIPIDIEGLAWSSLIAYYKMDDYSGETTKDSKNLGSDTTAARVYNPSHVNVQQAPMPFETSESGALQTVISQRNNVNGADIAHYSWSILSIQHDVTISENIENLGMIISPSATVILNNDNCIKNDWYLKLDGRIDLQGQSQLIQHENSNLDLNSIGEIERDQQGTTNKYNYNYWSSPVSSINSTANNKDFSVSEVLKDGTNPQNPQNIIWTNELGSQATSPITLSGFWIYKYQTVATSLANWSSVGPYGLLQPGVGFTLKGSNAVTPTQNYTFIGKPNNGDITVPILANNLNLTGNPYPSAIDANTFIANNLDSTSGTIYFWKHADTNTSHNLLDYQGGYSVRNLVGGTPAMTKVDASNTNAITSGRFIPVGQGFFVTGSSTGGQIKFNNAQRTFVKEQNLDSNTILRPSQSASLPETINNFEESFETDSYAKIRLGFTSYNNYHRQILLGFMDDKATSGINFGYDAIHIDTQPDDMSYLKGNRVLNILGESYFNENTIFPLSVKTSALGTVKFMVDGMENFADNQRVFIHDGFTGHYHSIKNQAFEIELPAGTFNNRFSLRFTDGTALTTDEMTLQNGIFIAYAPQKNTINLKNDTITATIQGITIYSMLGQSIDSWDIVNQDQNNIEIPVENLSAATYIVQIKTSNGDISKKIVIR